MFNVHKGLQTRPLWTTEGGGNTGTTFSPSSPSSLDLFATVWEIEINPVIYRSEIRELQRSITTYDMRYFPQHVLLCTSIVHD